MRTSRRGVNTRIVFPVLDKLLHVGESSLFLGLTSIGRQLHPMHVALPTWLTGEALGSQGASSAPGDAGWGITSPGPRLKEGLTFFSGRNGDTSSEARRVGSTQSREESAEEEVGLSLILTDSGWTHGEVTGTPPWLPDSTLAPPHASGPRAALTHIYYVRTALAVCLCS